MIGNWGWELTRQGVCGGRRSEYKVFLKPTVSVQPLHQPSPVGRWRWQHRQEPHGGGAAGDEGDVHGASSPAVEVHHLPTLHHGCTQGSFQTGGEHVWEKPWMREKIGLKVGMICPGEGGEHKGVGVLVHLRLCTSAHHSLAKGGPKVFLKGFPSSSWGIN